MSKNSLVLAMILTIGMKLVLSPASAYAFQLQQSPRLVNFKTSPLINNIENTNNQITAKKKKADKPKKRKSKNIKDYVYDPNRPDILPPVRRHKRGDSYS